MTKKVFFFLYFIFILSTFCPFSAPNPSETISPEIYSVTPNTGSSSLLTQVNIMGGQVLQLNPKCLSMAEGFIQPVRAICQDLP